MLPNRVFGVGGAHGNRPPRWPFTVNRWSPLANGLVGFWPGALTGSAGTLVDLASGANESTRNGGAITLSPESQFGGLMLNCAGAGVVVEDTILAAEATAIQWFICDNVATQQRLFCRGNSPSAGNDFTIQIFDSAVRGIFGSDGSAQKIAGSVSITSGVLYCVAARFVAGKGRVIINGSIQGTESASTSLSTALEPSALIGRADNGAGAATEKFTGRLGPAYLYSRALADAELRAHFDPQTRWSLYRELDRRLYSFPAAIGGSGTTGEIVSTLEEVSAALVGTPRVTGALAAVLEEVSAALVGAPLAAGTWASTLDEVTAALTGAPIAAGALAATLEEVSAALVGTPVVTGELATTLPEVSAALSSELSDVTGEIAGQLAEVSAAFVGAPVATGALAAALEEVSAALVGAPVVTGAWAATLDEVAAAFAGAPVAAGQVAATLEEISAAIVGSPIVTGALSATLAEVTAALENEEQGVPGLAAVALGGAGASVGVGP